jgi:hypothetical protein
VLGAANTACTHVVRSQRQLLTASALLELSTAVLMLAT